MWNLFFKQKSILILEIGAGTSYQAIRCISEELLDKFGPKKAKLVRINPLKGYGSVFGEHAFSFIDQSNFEQKSEESSQNIEIMHIKSTALQAITDLYNEVKRL